MENKITVGVFIILLFSLSIGNLLCGDRIFSDTENRYLSSKPPVAVSAVLSGNYAEKLEAYINDQFVWRDAWISLKTNAQITLLHKDINGVYLAKDGYLIQRVSEQDLNREQIEENIEAVNMFFARTSLPQKNLSLMIVPTSGLILSEKLPPFAPMFNQNEMIETIKQSVSDCLFVDLRQQLLDKKDEYIYFKTDHHWTTRGAFAAYLNWCDTVGIPSSEANYSIEEVTDSFRGSLYSKVLYNGVPYDSISIFKYQSPHSFLVEYEGGKSHSDSFYQRERLKEKDKYAVFFGGNHGELKITSDNKNNKRLLVIKDSFANAFVPFAAEQFESAHMLDLRYFHGSVYDYITNNDITDILVLYSTLNFASDHNLDKLRY
ncbi:MAG: DHHW family protein [Desulfitobacteriaceae bacterium]|nr:DHHW family protein [Desulfitobacteriaceae bacterium]